MNEKRAKRSPKEKAELAILTLKGEMRLVDIAAKHGVDPRVLQRWRNKLIDESEKLFVHKATERRQKIDPEKEELLLEIRKQELAIEYLKKKLEL